MPLKQILPMCVKDLWACDGVLLIDVCYRFSTPYKSVFGCLRPYPRRGFEVVTDIWNQFVNTPLF